MIVFCPCTAAPIQECPTDCDRTQQGCHHIWGPDSDHLEALRRNTKPEPSPAPTGIAAALHDALTRIYNERFRPDPRCPECMAPITWRFGGVGFICTAGHRLPGQDLPR